jgi:hypothetical protein
MLIRILKNYCCCFVEFHDNFYEVKEYCDGDFSFDQETKYFINQLNNSGKCATKEISENEKFFFTLKRFLERRLAEESSYIGFFEKTGEKVILHTERLVSGIGISPQENQKFLICPYFPEKIFFDNDFSRSILTSDGVITLGEDQFVGVRNGLIEELDVGEVLDIISKGETEKSPVFESLRLKPVTKRPSRPREGAVIYNKGSKKLEFYNGKDWSEI